MPIVEVAGGDVQSPGLLHPVLNVAEPEDQVDGGEQEEDEEAEQRGEQEDRGGEAGQADSGASGTAGTSRTPRHFVQSAVGGSLQAPLGISEALGVRRVVVPPLETAVHSVPLNHDSLQI